MTGPRRVWPLFLIAAGAFIPGFGLLFAALAVTWGLLADHPRALWAAGLAALGGLLNMVAAGVVLWRLHGTAEFDAAIRRSVEQDLVNVVEALEGYHTEWHEYPRELSLLGQGALSLKAVNLTDRSGGLFTARRNYQYVRSADGRTYDVFGVGSDRRAGTADDVRPILPDSLTGRIGYRPSR
jgi:hypothetical protein